MSSTWLTSAEGSTKGARRLKRHDSGRVSVQPMERSEWNPVPLRRCIISSYLMIAS